MSSTDNNNNRICIANECANCGKGEEESSSLKACTACKLVKYCNRECQIAHRPQHKKECRKRVKEIHDENLFKVVELEECPICFLLLPSLLTGGRYMSCCGKVICSGCIHAPVYDNQGNKVTQKKCPFCRTPTPTSEPEAMKRFKKRLEVGDAIAIHYQGNYYRAGRNGYRQDYTKALELHHRAAELGHVKSYLNIGNAYYKGRGVEVDMKRANHYYELAAMGGERQARYNLGIMEKNAGNLDRAIKHYMIAARDGYSDSVKKIQEMYSNGYATKEDYTKALQTYQKYLSEIKSEQRDKAAESNEDCRYY